MSMSFNADGPGALAAATQALIGWLALGLVLATSLAAGGTPPAAWIALCLGTLLLSAVQVALDIGGGLPQAARRAGWVAGLYLAVIAWVQVQGMTGLPASLAHPAWGSAPPGARATIAIDPDGARQVQMRLICYGLLFWLFLRSAGTPRRAEALVAAFAVFSTALALYGISVKLTGTNVLLGLDDTRESLRASFVNRNNFATYAVFGLLANISALFGALHRAGGRDRPRAWRDGPQAVSAATWVFALGVLVGAVALAFTQSRAGTAAGVIGVVTLIWALLRRQRAVRGHAIVLGAVLALVGLAVMQGTLARFGAASSDIRFLIFPGVIDGALDRPLLGHGAGGFADAFHAYVSLQGEEIEWQYAHNTYLENAFEFGLPAAAVLFIALALIGMRLVSGVLTRPDDTALPGFALACFAAAAFHAGFDGSLQIPAIAGAFAGILGIGWARSFD